MKLNDSVVRRINNAMRPYYQEVVCNNSVGKTLGQVSDRLNKITHEILVNKYKEDSGYGR